MSVDFRYRVCWTVESHWTCVPVRLNFLPHFSSCVYSVCMFDFSSNGRHSFISLTQSHSHIYFRRHDMELLCRSGDKWPARWGGVEPSRITAEQCQWVVFAFYRKFKYLSAAVWFRLTRTRCIDAALSVRFRAGRFGCCTWNLRVCNISNKFLQFS